VSVVEVKSSYLPVRGDVNGNWARLHQSGQWRPYTNAYQQALAAKNAVRSAMTTIKPTGSFYPDGHVVFTSGLAEGSQLTTGDFKVEVGTLDQFLSRLNIQKSTPWSLNDWQVFATKLGLRPVSVDEAIASREDQKATDLLNQYNAAVAVEHGKDAGRWLPESAEQRDNLAAAAANGAGCFVTGASGCGKTLMAKWVAVHKANAGNPTFFFAAKDFTGSWANAVRREVSLLCDQSPSALWSAISRADKPVFLVLDGINELGSNGPSALRGIRALATRLGAKLIVTGQSEKPSDFEGLHTVVVKPPSIDLKRRIAQSGDGVLTPRTLDLLKVVNSGIEAEIAGRMGQELNADASRLALLDQYIRMRLGRHARPGSFGLRRFASWLHQQVAFSASETAFDELMKVQLSFEDCDALFASGLLVRRGGRISFAHEMIQNASASFDLAQQAGADPSTFGLQLSTPFFEAIAGDIVSAIENTSICRAVLQAVTNPSLLCAAADGLLGRIAASVAGVLLDETVSACTEEIRSLRLALIKENGAVRVEWGEESKRRWTEAERAQLVAIGRRAESIAGLDVYLALCAEMDKRLASERRRLVESAREARFPLRSQSFRLAYYGFGNQVGFTHVSRAGHPGSQELVGEVQKPRLNFAEMSSGQLHFLLENRHAFSGNDKQDGFAENLIYLLRERFRWEPYNVQLAILHAAAFERSAPDETLARLVEAINGLEVSPENWAVNSSIIDALKFLGALHEDDETRNRIRGELYSVLGDDEDNADKDLALSLCVSMFDHPYDSIYGDEIFQLNESLRRRLYRRAFGASDIKKSMSLAWLSAEIASFDDAADAPLFWPLAVLPDRSNPFPQEEWGGFVIATCFLGRHACGLPAVTAEVPADLCLAEIRTLVYAAESGRAADLEDGRQAWQRLYTMPGQLVIGCLSEVDAALTERHWFKTKQAHKLRSLIDTYPAECLKVARRFVEDSLDRTLPSFEHKPLI
jgi:hypothetical protein